MNYYEIKIYTSTEGLDVVSDVLTMLDYDTFVIEDKSTVEELLEKKNPYDWDYVAEDVIARKDLESNITLYMEDDENAPASIGSIKKAVAMLKERDTEGVFGRLEVESRLACDDEWKDNWKQYFKPARITENIVIKPTWEEYDAEEEDIVIEIDPGMAFGTGTHPTTVMCVKYLEKYITSKDDSVLDVGCGSGILSMVAALCGSDDVKGVDIDPEAVAASMENIARNGLADKIEIFRGDVTEGLGVQADIIVANLMADLIIMIAPDIAGHLKGRKIFISSGILIEKRREVMEALEDAGFEVTGIMEEDEWCAIAARLM